MQHPPPKKKKSAKRSTFSYKAGQNEVLIGGLREVRINKSTFGVQKGPLLGGPTPPSKKIDPGYGPVSRACAVLINWLNHHGGKMRSEEIRKNIFPVVSLLL